MRHDSCIQTGWPSVDRCIGISEATSGPRRPAASGLTPVERAREDLAALQNRTSRTTRPRITSSPGGLVRGGLHEFLGLFGPDGDLPSRTWTPPMGVLGRLAHAALTHASPSRGTVAWIGQRIRPEPGALPRDSTDLATASMVIRPRGTTARFWAIERTLRCPAVCCVIADGSDTSQLISRRLHLVAEDHDCTLVLARPPRDQLALSSASTRWRVRRSPTTGHHPRWRLDLLRCRGRQRLIGRDPPPLLPASDLDSSVCSWLLEWDPVHGPLDISNADPVSCAPPSTSHPVRMAAYLAHRSGRPASATPRRHA